jgi:hypothetical protein
MLTYPALHLRPREMKKAFNFRYNFFRQETILTKRKKPFMQRLSIKVTSNAKTLSSYSGLHLFSDLISKFEFQALVGPFLPKKQRERGFSSFQKLYAGILGFVAGAECLDDFDWLGHDPLFEQLTDSPSSITMGKFLRTFSLR